MTEGDAITDLHAKLQRDIRKVELSGDTTVDELASIEATLKELVNLIKLFLISERDTYYGYFFMSMRLRADFRCNSIAGIKLNEYPPVLVSNPLLLGKFSLKEITYIICHEIDHVLFNHPAEMARLGPEDGEDAHRLFNLAADAAVNDGLNSEVAGGAFYMRMPKDVITSQTLRTTFDLPDLLSNESYLYYFDRIHNKSVSPDSPDCKSMMLSGKAAESGGISESDGSQTSQEEDGIVTAGSALPVEDHDWGIDDPEEAACAAREAVNAAVTLMDSESRGNMPAAFLEQVTRINQPPRISWQSLFKKYVGSINSGTRKTRSRLNRRQPLRYDLSGSVADTILKIVVAIDTSGSISSDDLTAIFNEIFAILSHRRYEITVIECDCQIQRVYQVCKPADVRPDVGGRGGTMFSPVIEYINERRYFRDALLIYFTDGYGERRIPRPLTYRNLWVVIGGSENLSLREPYGTVVALED